MGTSYVSLLWGYPHYEYYEANKSSLDLHWSHWNKPLLTVRKGLNHRSARTNFQSIFFTLQRVEFYSHFFLGFQANQGISSLSKTCKHLIRKYLVPKIIPLNIPFQHPKMSGSYWFRNGGAFCNKTSTKNPAKNLLGTLAAWSKKNKSSISNRQERSGSESSFVTSLAGSLPKVRPRDVLTGGRWTAHLPVDVGETGCFFLVEGGRLLLVEHICFTYICIYIFTWCRYTWIIVISPISVVDLVTFLYLPRITLEFWFWNLGPWQQKE